MPIAGVVQRPRSAENCPTPYSEVRHCPGSGRSANLCAQLFPSFSNEANMGYIVAWALGVPAVILVGIYLFTHLL